jgi:limonene-1,2-epoxide hydrolase
MKKQLFGLIALALLTLVACQQAAEVQETEAPDYAAFDKSVEVVRSFIQAHCDEDLEAEGNLLADTLKWSPPEYNGNKQLGKDDFLAALKGYHDDFENIKYTEGITVGDSLVNGMWSGSHFPKDLATSGGTNVRVYGTWTATHTASGKDIGVKYFALCFVNADGKIETWSDYFDLHGIYAQLEDEEEGGEEASEE